MSKAINVPPGMDIDMLKAPHSEKRHFSVNGRNLCGAVKRLRHVFDYEIEINFTSRALLDTTISALCNQVNLCQTCVKILKEELALHVRAVLRAHAGEVVCQATADAIATDLGLVKGAVFFNDDDELVVSQLEKDTRANLYRRKVAAGAKA